MVRAEPPRISDLGEELLLQRVRTVFAVPSQPGVIGIGDDCAVIPPQPSCTLLTTDGLVEGVHFRRDWSTPAQLGWKTVAVNLSDIAAMGGTPRFALLSLSLPSDLSVTWFDGFIGGVRELASAVGVQVLGGNMARSDSGIQISLTMLGEAPPNGAKLRSGAQVGDVLCVTGRLGGARGGLHVLQHGLQDDARWEELVEQQLEPRPHVREGIVLGVEPAVHALMDVSDGLASDLPRLLAASGVGAHVRLESLPTLSGLRALCQTRQLLLEEFAYGGGEDYVLLAAVAGHEFSQVAERFRASCGGELSAIGECVKGAGVRLTCRGVEVQHPSSAFHHFEPRR